MVAMAQQGYKGRRGFSKEKLKHMELWHNLCKKHMDAYGVRHCFTWNCPLAKPYGCFQFMNYDEFEKQYHADLKQLRHDIRMACEESGVIL